MTEGIMIGDVKTTAAIFARLRDMGVETEQQLDFLRERGCTGFQGYYFSKPLNADEFSRLIEMYEASVAS